MAAAAWRAGGQQDLRLALQRVDGGGATDGLGVQTAADGGPDPEREGLRLEAVLKVALDILAAAAT